MAALAALLTAANLQTILGSSQLAGGVMSLPLWNGVVTGLGGTVQTPPDAPPYADVAFLPCLAIVLIGIVLVVGMGAAWLRWRTGGFAAAVDWVRRSANWWLLPGAWEILRLVAFVLGWDGALALLAGTLPMWYAVAAAGCLATLLTLGWPAERTLAVNAGEAVNSRRAWAILGSVIGLYVVAFVAMNWQLWFSLRIPHGDSAMYEEHLWNLTHGKGFRSYLDQGLFLGEHIQVIHVLLVPLHVVWPSHLLLELCESLALASGAIPVFWIARRHAASERAALLLAAAYLLYFPMHFLDIAIDLKTFRPNAFGIPVLLFAIDQLERRRYRSFVALLVLSLTAQEDYAAVLAPFGLWIALRAGRLESEPRRVRNVRWLGLAVMVLSAVYLVAVVTVVLPWFREGATVHYARYFGELGDSPKDIVASLFTQPGVVLGKLFSARSLIYLLALLVPVGMLPVLSPGRLAIAAPWFGILCLMELGGEPLVPFHHFHAQVIPFVFWGAAAGLPAYGRLASRVARRLAERTGRPQDPLAESADFLGWGAAFAFSSALACGVFYGFSPLGLGFWDPGSPAFWQTRYVPDRRAELFPRVLEAIPRDARVASTDFVHPRFTHYERSYDYSHYRRRVAGYEERVPADTDYIVIDTRHKYSDVRGPDDVRELREEPEKWELLPDETEGYFIVLKRKSESQPERGP